MYYVYVIRSSKTQKLYIGSTNDLKRRIQEHNNGKIFSTRGIGPFQLLYYEAYISEKAARRRERQLKYFGKAYQELKKRIQGAG